MKSPETTKAAHPGGDGDLRNVEQLRGRLDNTPTPALNVLQGCRDCGASFRARRATQEFCCSGCRQAFHNRASSRGAELYHLVMAMRFDRASAEAFGAWSLMCRMAAAFKAEDDRDRAGRTSWNDIPAVKARNTHLGSTVVCLDAAGVRRRACQ